MRDQLRWTIEALGREIADTERYAGGGAVAAMSLVGAAATAELVISLTVRRRGLGPMEIDRLEAHRELAAELRRNFLDAIDTDIASLTELMNAQRERRRARKATDQGDLQSAEERMRHAVQAAIDVPLAVAGDATKLLDAINETRSHARLFTMSDLAAAAATTQGAIISLLLMAEANLSLLEESEQVERVQRDIGSIWRTTSMAADEIIKSTRDATYQNLRRGG
jgi:formiminotetrahydrofolate cyclodeaminase